MTRDAICTENVCREPERDADIPIRWLLLTWAALSLAGITLAMWITR